MTQGHEPSRVRLNEGAERLLESLTGSIVKEARRAAVRRNDPASEVSPIDIVTGLESRRERSRRRDRSAFAVQVLGTAVSLSAVVIVFSGGLLAVGDWKIGADQMAPLFTTVLLALLTVVSATLLLFRIGDISNGFRGRPLGGSRYKDELALLQAWQVFEDAMRRSVEDEDVGSKSERLDLSTVILRFSDRYGVDPKHVKKVLGVRNAVAHNRTSRVSAREVRASLEDLRKLHDVLGFSDYGVR